MTFTYVSSGQSGEGRSGSMPRESMLRLKIPEGATGGGSFPVVLPDGSRVSVLVPDGAMPGEEIEIPIPTGSRPSGQRPMTESERRERDEFLAALPEEIRSEILAADPSSRQLAISEEQPNKWIDMVQVKIPEGCTEGSKFRTQMPDGRSVVLEVPPGFTGGEIIGVPSNIELEDDQELQEPQRNLSENEQQEREAFLSALPDDIRAEVLAQEGPQIPPQPEPAPIQSSKDNEGGQQIDLLGAYEGEDRNFHFENSLLDLPVSQQNAQQLHDKQITKEATVNLMGSDEAAPVSKEPFHQPPSASAKPKEFPLYTSAMTTSPPKPPLERLKEAKQQLDQGEITQEEFEEIKKQVIAAI